MASWRARSSGARRRGHPAGGDRRVRRRRRARVWKRSGVTIGDRFHPREGHDRDARRDVWRGGSRSQPAPRRRYARAALSHSSGIPSDTDEIERLYFNVDAFRYNLPALHLGALRRWKSHAPETRPGASFRSANLGDLIAGVGRGKRGSALVKPETMASIHRPRGRPAGCPVRFQGTPQVGDSALGWGVVKFDWSRGRSSRITGPMG